MRYLSAMDDDDFLSYGAGRYIGFSLLGNVLLRECGV